MIIMEQIEGIIYEYFIVCKINNEYQFLSVANKNNKEYSTGTYFFGNNYEEILIFQTFDDAKRDIDYGNFLREKCIKIGWNVGQLSVASVPRKIKFNLDNYTEGG